MAPYIDKEELYAMGMTDRERSRSPSATIVTNEDGDHGRRGAPKPSMTPDTESTTGSVTTIRSNKKRSRKESANREWELKFELIREGGDDFRWCRHTNPDGTRCSKKYRLSHGTTAAKRHAESHAREDRQNVNQSSLSRFMADNYKSRPMISTEQRRALIVMIIMQDHPFNIVDQQWFIEFFKTIEPGRRMPSRRTIARDIETLFYRAKAALKKRLQTAARVSLIADGWTANMQRIGYLGTMASFVESSHKGEDSFVHTGTWQRRTIVLNMREVQTDIQHTGDVLAQDVFNILKDYDIVNRFFALVTDNASNMAKAADVLRKKVVEEGVTLLKGWHVRCLSHILNLVTEGFLAGLNSGGSTADLRRRTYTSRAERSALHTLNITKVSRDILWEARDEPDRQDHPNESIFRLDDMLIAEDGSDEDDMNESSDDDLVRAPERQGRSTRKGKGKAKRPKRNTQATSDDDNPPTYTASGHGVRFGLRPKKGTLGHAIRALRFIGLYVHSSPKRRAAFLNINPDSPLPKQEVVTRWSSTYEMLERAVQLREQILAFTHSIEAFFVDAIPVARDFDIAEDAVKILWPFFRVVKLSQRCEKSGDDTLCSAVVALDYVFDHLDDLMDGGDNIKVDLQRLGYYDDVVVGVKIAKVVLRKYYARTDADLHSAATFVNPSMRASWWKAKFGTELHSLQTCIDQARAVYDIYAQNHRAISSARRDPPKEECTQMIDIAFEVMNDEPKDEFLLYKDGGLAPKKTKALDWWSQHCTEFPVIARIAADVLGVPGSSAAMEGEFSRARKLLHYQRSRIREYRVNMVSCLRSWIREFGRDWVMNTLTVLTDEDDEKASEHPFEHMPKADLGAPEDAEEVFQ